MDSEGDVAQPGEIRPLGRMDSTRKYDLMNEEGRNLFRRWHVIVGVDLETAIWLVECWPGFPIHNLQYPSPISRVANTILVPLNRE